MDYRILERCRLATLFLIVGACSPGENSCRVEPDEDSSTSADRGTPEHILFLVTASDAMEEYYKANGRFPQDWTSLGLGFTYFAGFYVGDPEAYPRPGATLLWKPKNCKFTYELSHVSKNAFRISALSKDGAPQYYIERGMKKPQSTNPKAERAAEDVEETTEDED